MNKYLTVPVFVAAGYFAAALTTANAVPHDKVYPVQPPKIEIGDLLPEPPEKSPEFTKPGPEPRKTPEEKYKSRRGFEGKF